MSASTSERSDAGASSACSDAIVARSVASRIATGASTTNRVTAPTVPQKFSDGGWAARLFAMYDAAELGTAIAAHPDDEQTPRTTRRARRASSLRPARIVLRR
ncbi:MAG: hypothetical protein L0I76_12185 [Pseudonocardia sp.]|nr:hypothetical protein [Pseudonocardia sp.]